MSGDEKRLSGDCSIHRHCLVSSNHLFNHEWMPPYVCVGDKNSNMPTEILMLFVWSFHTPTLPSTFYVIVLLWTQTGFVHMGLVSYTCTFWCLKMHSSDGYKVGLNLDYCAQWYSKGPEIKPQRKIKVTHSRLVTIFILTCTCMYKPYSRSRPTVNR